MVRIKWVIMSTTEKTQYQCEDHPNCIYRIELLESWRDKLDSKLNDLKSSMDKRLDDFKKTVDSRFEKIQGLLISILVAVCTLLLGSLVGLGIWVVKAV